MFGSIKTYAVLQSFLIEKLNDKTKALAAFDKARTENNLVHFFHWNGLDMHSDVVHAFRAQVYLDYMDREIDKPAEEVFANIVEDVTRQIKNINPRISRSTSPSANYEDDFSNSFYLELNSKFQ